MQDHSIDTRLNNAERDVQAHAKTISEMTLFLADLRQGKAIEAVEARYLDERLDRIEASLSSVYGLGKWLLGAIGSVLVVAIVGFILKGGPLA